MAPPLPAVHPEGLIVQELEHGSLKLTAKAWDVLRGKEPVRGRLEEAKISLKTRAESDGRFDADLFAILRKKRKEIADGANLRRSRSSTTGP